MQLQTYGNFSGAGKPGVKTIGKYSIKGGISRRGTINTRLYIKQLSVFAVFRSKIVIRLRFFPNLLFLYLVDYPTSQINLN
nr:hypothetical protein [uncultured Chitinophaga sp.]